MNLRHDIKRILREETNKDLSPLIEKVLNDMLVKYNKDILCGVTVVHPDNRESLPDAFGNNFKFTSYKVTFIFIGGYGSDNWPATQSVRRMFDDLMNEAWDLIYNYTGQKLDMYTKHVNSCDDIIKESKDNSISDMIKTLGVSDAIKYFGNYDKFDSYLTDSDKVDFIENTVYRLAEEMESDFIGVGLQEIDEEPIHYNDEDGQIHQIEYLGRKSVEVYYYDDNGDIHIGDYYVRYDSLPTQILDEIFRMLLDK